MASNLLAMASNLVSYNIGFVENYSKGPLTYPCLMFITPDEYSERTPRITKYCK